MPAPARSRAGLRTSVQDSLKSITQQGLLRKASVVSKRNSNEIVINNQRLINFASNDYLGLSNHPEVNRAIVETCDRFGFGSTASPLICGKSVIHLQLEEALARRTGRDRALLFPCGYSANIGTITAVSGFDGVELFLDRLCHASIIDGVLLARRRFRRYRHADAAALDARLAASKSKKKLVLTESIFSMDGDICPLQDLSASARERGATLIVDDAHGFGVMGTNGNGTLEHFNLGQDEVPLMMGTFGKAIGLSGAFVAGRDDLVELLVQKARPYIYSTAMPVAIAAGIKTSLQVIDAEPERRKKLFGLIAYFHDSLTQAGISAPATGTPIQPIIIGDPDKTMAACEQLRDRGMYVAGIRPPTVPNKTARLRISLNAAHSRQQLDELVDALSTVLDQKSVCR